MERLFLLKPFLSSSRHKTRGSLESPLFPPAPPAALRATLPLSDTSQRCSQSPAEWTGHLPSLPPSSPSLLACEGSWDKMLFAGDASQHRPLEPPFSLRKDFPLQTSLGHLRCEAAGCRQCCLAPAISASAGVKRCWGCQLLTQPVVVLSINSFTMFNYRQRSLKGFKMHRDINSPPMLVYKSLSLSFAQL